MIRLYKTDDGQFYFKIIGLNGRTIITSDMYKRKENALKGIAVMSDVVILSCGLSKDAAKEIEFDDFTNAKN